MIYYIKNRGDILIDKLIKNIINIVILMVIFVLYVSYSPLILLGLKNIGFNIDALSNVYKSICLILIDMSLMLITYLFYYKENNRELRKYNNNIVKYFTFGFIMWIIGIVLMISSNLLIHYFYPSSVALNEESVQEALKLSPIYMAFSACIFAPFMEEMIFRKCVKKFITSDFIFILVSGLLFGFAHNIGVIGKTDMIYIIPYGLFGCVFAYTYIKTRNIFVPITFHMIHNTILVIFSLISMGVLK